jgi:hypothetical protein
MKVSSASTIPLKLRGLLTTGAQKPMPPAEPGRRMNAAERRRLRQSFALDHRPGVIKPFFPLAQMHHRRVGQRIEGAPAVHTRKRRETKLGSTH